MATAKIQTPDGKTITIQVPDGATEQQIMEFVQSNYKPKQVAQPQPTLPENQQAAQISPQESKGLVERTIGGLSAAATMTADIAGASTAGLTALVDTFNPFTDNDATATIKNVRDKFRIEPTASAEDAFALIDKTVEPIKPLMEWVDNFKKTAGNQALDLTGSPVIATFVQMLPDIALELTALGRATKSPDVSRFSLDDANPRASEMNTAKLADEASNKTNIDLFQAQKTLNPTDLERQAFVAQLPAGAVKARESLGLQNRQSLDAVDSVLNSLAIPEATGSAAVVFRTAAQKAVETTKRIRREASSPIYKQAARRQREGNTGPIDTAQLQTKVSEMSKQFDQNGQIAKNLNAAAKKISSAGGDLQKLHNAKLEIDQTINSFGEGAVGNTTKRFLTDVVKDLTDNLTTQSPSYRAAKAEFQRLSGPVNKIQDSQIGKIANMDDVQLKSAAKQIFDPSETNPEIIVSARKVINDADPAAWNAITRAEIERRMGRIRADIGSPNNIQAVENIPSQLFNSIFGNKKSRDVLYAAVDPDTRSNLKYLETALKRATTGRPGGSQTAIRAEISQELKGGVAQSIRDFIRSPIDKSISVGENAMFDARVKALSNVLFDPSYKVEMKKLRGLNPESTAAKKYFDRLITSSLALAPLAINSDEEQQ
jgi:hypothetical protein